LPADGVTINYNNNDNMNTTLLRGIIFLTIIVALLELFSEITDNRILHLYSKPLIVIVVALYFLTATRLSQSKIKIIIVAALFFSWLGDLFLMFKQEYSWTFLCGLGAFLVSHIFYIAAYRAGSEGRFQLSFYIVVPVIGYGVVLFSVLAPHLDTMHIPVALYAVVLLSMFVAALERRQRVSEESFWWAFGGAICFVLSDSILAWHSFVQPSAVARVTLMTLYIAAQYAIARGMALHITTSQQQQ
jgi:uncharacterized membrane protein YhhN